MKSLNKTKESFIPEIIFCELCIVAIAIAGGEQLRIQTNLSSGTAIVDMILIAATLNVIALIAVLAAMAVKTIRIKKKPEEGILMEMDLKISMKPGVAQKKSPWSDSFLRHYKKSMSPKELVNFGETKGRS